MKRIITYGTFDMFHVGHLRLLKRLSELGDELIVGVSTDEFNLLKGKKTLIPFEQRAEIVAAIDCVDKVIPETDWNQKIEDIQKFEVDLFVMGDDWTGEFDFLSDYCEVKYLERTADISTTMLKESLGHITKINKEALMQAFDILENLKNDLL